MTLDSITIPQRKRIAALAGIAECSLRHVQAGRREASAEFAIKVERAAKRIGLEVRRESMCEACKGCELAKKARKAE